MGLVIMSHILIWIYQRQFFLCISLYEGDSVLPAKCEETGLVSGSFLMMF